MSTVMDHDGLDRVTLLVPLAQVLYSWTLQKELLDLWEEADP